MIISVENLRKQVDCGTTDVEVIETRLESIESVIRAYTNNNFQQRAIRFVGESEGVRVYGNPLYFAEGDTVQISNPVNGGLYTVYAVADEYLELDRPIMSVPDNMVTKVKYPADVVQCAVDLFKWHQSMGDKVGVKSETLSRHSVTYEDSATLFMGYPVGILNGLNLYKKARF